MPDYTTAAAFRTRTNIPSTVVDATLEAILDGVEASIAMYLGYDPQGGTATEYYDGDGTPLLVLGRKGVASVSAVYEDRRGFYGDNADGFDIETELDAGVGYALQVRGPDRTGVLVRIDGIWPYVQRRGWRRLSNSKSPCLGCVQVTYTTDTITQDVIEAAYLEGIARYGTMSTGIGAQTSSSLDARSVSVTPFQRRQGDGVTSPFLSPAAEIMLAFRKRKSIY